MRAKSACFAASLGFATMNGADPPRAENRTQDMRRITPVAVAAIVGAALSAWAFVWARHSETERIQREVGRLSVRGASDIENSVGLYTAAIESVGAFFHASREVELEEFSEFTLGLLDHHPGIDALAWVETAHDTDPKVVHIAVQGETANLQDAEQSPARRRDANAIVQRAIVGNTAAVARIRSGGRATVAQMVRLSEDPHIMGSVVALPIYAHGESLPLVEDEHGDTEAARALRKRTPFRYKSAGFVVAVIRVPTMIDRALASLDDDGTLKFRVRDVGVDGPDRILFLSQGWQVINDHENSGESRIGESETITMGGSTWRLR
jgi:hypothetical protein